MPISASQYRHMTRFQRANILPRVYDLLLDLELQDNLSEWGRKELDALRDIDRLASLAPCPPQTR